jgi:hypothetical protein
VSTHRYRDQSLLDRNSAPRWPMLWLDRPAVLGKGVARILSSNPKSYRVNPPPVGIRPSVTISSNFVTATPRYSAAWTRETRGKRARKGYWPDLRPIALVPHLGWQSAIRNLFKIDPIEPGMDG